MHISEFQELIKKLYYNKDRSRGVEKTFIWLVEEIGELATILKRNNHEREGLKAEIADIIAWTTSLANLLDIEVESALKEKYPNKCVKCGSIPCNCKELTTD
jgi:NTP pyrophosphatase (non-canonical NTP hydrolase)